MRTIGGLLVGAAAAALLLAPNAHAQELAYELTEGQNINAFVRDGTVSAHMLLRSGTEPRILFAFPAGNSGVGLWFAPLAQPALWSVDTKPTPVAVKDTKGRTLNGVRTVATIAAPRLEVKQAVLSNVRFLRDYQAIGKVPAELLTAMRSAPGRILFARDRVDGAPGYHLELRVLAGRIDGGTITAGSDGVIRLEIIAATGDKPLTGLTAEELLTERAADDPSARDALRFLSYREKFLAGSWRFNTYFGRDTLMSLRLLMPVLKPAAMEAGLESVVARLNDAGEVAHEEALGEFAILERRAGGEASDAATLDYAMVDDDFMLAPVAASYLLDRASADTARAWLAKPVRSEALPGLQESTGAALVRNLRFVLQSARAFAKTPTVPNLIALKSGRQNGQWRDSNEGLGGGRYAYDVNAIFVPAALEAAARLHKAGLLDPYLTSADRAVFARAAVDARIWRRYAPRPFKVTIPADQAKSAVASYAASLGVPADPAIAAIGTAPLTFHAISLDDKGVPIPIVNTDEAFDLMFGMPAPAELETSVRAMMRPFPAGLLTDVGVVVANAAHTAPKLQADFTPAKYHGAVVWSWQQALLAAGLERQLARTDLPATTRATLMRAQDDLWRVIKAARAVQSSELWSWAFKDGAYQVVAFGAGKQDVDESNAAQLWSTVYLAVQPPR